MSSLVTLSEELGKTIRILPGFHDKKGIEYVDPSNDVYIIVLPYARDIIDIYFFLYMHLHNKPVAMLGLEWKSPEEKLPHPIEFSNINELIEKLREIYKNCEIYVKEIGSNQYLIAIFDPTNLKITLGLATAHEKDGKYVITELRDVCHLVILALNNVDVKTVIEELFKIYYAIYHIVSNP